MNLVNKKRLVKSLEWMMHDLKTQPITVGGQALRELKANQIIELLNKEVLNND